MSSSRAFYILEQYFFAITPGMTIAYINGPMYSMNNETMMISLTWMYSSTNRLSQNKNPDWLLLYFLLLLIVLVVPVAWC